MDTIEILAWIELDGWEMSRICIEKLSYDSVNLINREKLSKEELDQIFNCDYLSASDFF